MTQEPELVTAALIAAVFGSMLLLERLRPLRRTVEPKPRRIARNLTTGGLAFAAVVLPAAPLLAPLSRWVMVRRIGILNLAGATGPLHVILAVVLLDYTLWFWHFANHRVPFLWRFHLVHHVDLDLDSSTALRFHFGEHALSMAYRAVQIVVIGASPAAVWTWQLILFAAILFHHGNLALPPGLERWVVRIIVTPRMHGIHHSNQFNETDSNWSSMLSVWDYLHGTILLNVPQRDVTIGVPAYQDPAEVTVGKIQVIPFRHQRKDWQRADGTLQRRGHAEPLAELAE